ncbi:hypothetical protein ACMFMG_000476 [Clarireedia jacksonii]
MFSRGKKSGNKDDGKDGKDGKGGKKNQKAAPAESSKTGGRHKLSGEKKKGNSIEPSEEIKAEIAAAARQLKEKLAKQKEDDEFEEAKSWYASAKLAPEDRALSILPARKAAPPIDPSAVAVSPDTAVVPVLFPEATNDRNTSSRQGHHPRHSSPHRRKTGGKMPL